MAPAVAGGNLNQIIEPGRHDELDAIPTPWPWPSIAQ